jgi:hypothetical protein
VARQTTPLVCGFCGSGVTSGAGYVRVEDSPVHIRCLAAQSARPKDIETLLTSLRDSPTDLSRIVIEVVPPPAHDHLSISAHD